MAMAPGPGTTAAAPCPGMAWTAEWRRLVGGCSVVERMGKRRGPWWSGWGRGCTSSPASARKRWGRGGARGGVVGEQHGSREGRTEGETGRRRQDSGGGEGSPRGKRGARVLASGATDCQMTWGHGPGPKTTWEHGPGKRRGSRGDTGLPNGPSEYHRFQDQG
jgi:hypothetical protein